MLTPIRLLARLPLRVLHPFATLIYWLAFRIGRVRVELVERQIGNAFPELDAAARARLVDAYHRQIADVAVEVLKAFAISREELTERVRIDGLEAVRARLAAGQPVLLLTAHHCNWEWLMLALSVELGHPVDAIYKPLKDERAERAFRWMRSRFGGHLTPAKQIVPEIIGRRSLVRLVGMVADQVPVSSSSRYWTRFLNQDTAFYMGAEEIARAVGFPVYLLLGERVARSRYRARVELLAEPGDGSQQPKEITRRYATRLEAHLRAHPAEWFWSHDRWKLRKPLYAR